MKNYFFKNNFSPETSNKVKKGNDKNVTIHKLNNLLANVGLSTELLLKEIYGTLSVKQKEYLNGILSDSKKMKNLIKKLR